MRNKCQWPGCGVVPADCRVHGTPYCSTHQTEALRQIVLAGIESRSNPEAEGFPREKGWLNCFARLIEKETDSWAHSLSKAKIEHRSEDFKIEGKVVEFSIVRHPVGRVQEQRWKFNVETDDLSLVSERDLESKYPWDTATGSYECPECGNTGLDVSPGRARCFECGYEDLHEHSW